MKMHWSRLLSALSFPIFGSAISLRIPFLSDRANEIDLGLQINDPPDLQTHSLRSRDSLLFDDSEASYNPPLPPYDSNIGLFSSPDDNDITASANLDTSSIGPFDPLPATNWFLEDLPAESPPLQQVSYLDGGGNDIIAPDEASPDSLFVSKNGDGDLSFDPFSFSDWVDLILGPQRTFAFPQCGDGYSYTLCCLPPVDGSPNRDTCLICSCLPFFSFPSCITSHSLAPSP